jgi:2-(1,2-epoxy-1,2-dihydrophenyl)acetyl-CoA isomerase
MTESETVRLNVADGVARITLNRPERRNAFNTPMANLWTQITEEVTQRSDVIAIVIDAAGPAFCAGGDVMEMATSMTSGKDATEFVRVINRGQLALLKSAKPVIAAVQGVTAGGGLGIVLSSDYAVMAEDARIGSRYANMGLTPDLSVTALLGRAVGERRALQLITQDRLLSATEAVEWGLIAEAVSREDVLPRALTIARAWASLPDGAYGRAKRLLRAAPFRSLEESLSDEAHTVGIAFDTQDAKTRIQAFAGTAGRRSGS